MIDTLLEGLVGGFVLFITLVILAWSYGVNMNREIKGLWIEVLRSGCFEHLKYLLIGSLTIVGVCAAFHWFYHLPMLDRILTLLTYFLVGGIVVAMLLYFTWSVGKFVHSLWGTK